MQIPFDILIDVLFIAGLLLLIAVVLIGWLRNPRLSQTRIVGTNSLFFSGSAVTKSVISLVASIAAVYLGYLLWVPFVSIAAELAPFLKIVGLIIYLGGAALVLWARWTLGKNWSVSTSFGVQLQADHRLVEGGAFAWVRHPMYVGAWTLMFGALLAYRTWALLILLPMVLASFYFRARREEAALEATFGDEWHRYTSHVGKFLPHLRKSKTGEGAAIP